MKVYVFPSDMEGCGMYRLVWPAWELKRQGYDVEVVLPHHRGTVLSAGFNTRGEIATVVMPSDADVIVIQRVSHVHMVGSIPLMRAQGVAVVTDVDDDLEAIHPSNVAYQVLHPDARFRPEHTWVNVRLACEASTVVTVSTPALQGVYGRNKNSMVIPNCVPARYLEVPRRDSDIVGWGGSLHSHPDDMVPLGDSIARLTREGMRFRVVGNGEGMRGALGLAQDPEVTGVVDLTTAWPETLATLGVGIAPLSNSRFNRSKSRLKVLEMASVGVPTVASPRDEYTRMHDDGIGLLANKPGDWYRELRRLSRDARLRAELSERGRAVAMRNTIERNAEIWWSAWEAAYNLEHGQRAAVINRQVLSPFGLGVVDA